MTIIVEPSQSRTITSPTVAAIARYGPGDWIVPSGTDVNATRANLSGVPLNAAAISSSGLDVSIDTFEAFIEGAYVASDDASVAAHTHTLAGNSATTTLYLGYDLSATDTFIFGPVGEFAAEDPKIPIADVTDDGASVTSTTDRRPLGGRLESSRLELDPQDADAINSPSEGTIAYHDGSGGDTEGPAFYNGSGWVWHGQTSTPFGTVLEGSDDLSTPRTGLETEISNAITAGQPLITITGAWEMGSGVSFSSASDTPSANTPIRRLPVHIDASGAAIDYTGTGWAFTNDCTGNISGQIDGGRFVLEGGVWANSGSASGFIRGIDITFNQFYPQTTRDFPTVYQPEIGTAWCESNTFGGQHQAVDRGINAVGSGGDSFQDNFIDDIQVGNCSTYGFDLSGNWNDCYAANPTVILNSEDAAAIHNDGNLDGFVFDVLEVEDAASDLTNYYIYEPGPNVTNRGPTLTGMKNDYHLGTGLSYVNEANAGGTWNVWMDETSGGNRDWYRFTGDAGGFGTQHRWRFSDGLYHQTASTPGGTYSTAGSI